MKLNKETIRERSLEEIVANTNNECRWCPAKDCSVCVWKYR